MDAIEIAGPVGAVISNNSTHRILFTAIIKQLLLKSKKIIIVAGKESANAYSQILTKSGINLQKEIQSKNILYIDCTYSDWVPYSNIPISESTPPHYAQFSGALKAQYSQIFNIISESVGYNALIIDDAFDLVNELSCNWLVALNSFIMLWKLKSITSMLFLSEFEIKINSSLSSILSDFDLATIHIPSHTYEPNTNKSGGQIVVQDHGKCIKYMYTVVDNKLQ